MKYRSMLLLLVSLIIGSIGCTGQKSRETAFYVSLAGNDFWSGKLAEPNNDGSDGPFATLEKARDTVRAFKKQDSFSQGGITVNLRGGTYHLSGTFMLSSEDSGTESSPITWRAYPGEEVNVIGGKEISGFVSITDSAVLKRIAPDFHSKIVQSDLKAQGIADFGEINKNGCPGLELFFKGKRMTLARWPNEGWLTIESVPQTGEKLIYEGMDYQKRFGIRVGRHFGRFTYSGDRPRGWDKSSYEDMWMLGFWSFDYYGSYQKVERIDTKKRDIYLAPPFYTYGYTRDQRYYFCNILEEIDSPGEWYLDRKKGILYFWPPDTIAEGDVTVSILEGPLLSMEKTDYCTVRGIHFSCSRGGGVTVKDGSHSVIAGCTFTNLGDTAVTIDGKENGITGCDIYDVALGGIVLDGGDRKTLTPAGNYATNNHIHDYSTWVMTYQLGIRINGVGNHIANNVIHDAPQEGMYLKGNDHIVEFNEIYHIGKQTGDVGAIHSGLDWTERGSIIRYNYFHHLLPTLHGLSYSGVIAVYPDDFTSGLTVLGNIFYKAGQGIHMGGGRDNLIENNIFVECEPSVHLDARGLTWASNWMGDSTNVRPVTRHLFDRLEEMHYKEPPYSERYPELLTYPEDDPGVPKNNRIICNVSFGGRMLDLYDGLDFTILSMKENVIADTVLCRWQKTFVKKGDRDFTNYKYGDQTIMDILKENGNVVLDTDPGFVDVASKNFNLRDDSPVWKLGFKPIPFDKIGLYIDEYRTFLPEKKE